MKLRLYHHPDGARIAYREAGTGPPLGLVHSAGLSHREWEPVVEHLADRFRVVLPDLPLHGDSEDRPRHPYSPDWLAEVIAGFCRDTLGAHPLVAGHEAGADLLLRAVVSGRLEPARLVLMSSRMHAPPARTAMLRSWRLAARAGALPGLDRALSHGAGLVMRPVLSARVSARNKPQAQDLVHHALGDLPGNGNRARSWAKLARHWPTRPDASLLDAYADIACPVLLLWATDDPHHPLETAEQALARLPEAHLRLLPGTGFLMAYDDPVGVARELAAFCG